MAEKFEHCYACGQKIMKYRRNIRKAMIYGLIKLWKLGPCKISELNLSKGVHSDFITLRHWGLIFRPDSLKRSTWQITKKGTDFLFNQVEVREYLMIFNNRIVEQSEEFVSLEEIHPEKIDFDKILAEAEPMIQ